MPDKRRRREQKKAKTAETPEDFNRIRRKRMDKKPFVTLEQLKEITKTYPTPFHLYDEKGIRENAERLKRAFSWNKGFREYFAVKATPNPFIIDILKKLDCGVDCSSLTELMMAEAMEYDGEKIMFSSNDKIGRAHV